MDIHALPSDVIAAFAPAKLNLYFEVLSRRPDGFHEIETLMTPVDFGDELRVRSRSSGAIRLECQWDRRVAREARYWKSPREQSSGPGPLPDSQHNLVYRALVALRATAGIELGADVELIKRIPLEAGLAGGSSDAAAALAAANVAWGLHWPVERLAEVAARVGSDTPFFLGAGRGRRRLAAICRGRGERIESICALPTQWTVIVKPAAGLATADVYRRCRPMADAQRSSERTERLARALCAGDRRASMRLVGNRLEEAAEQLSPWPGRLRGAFARCDCAPAQMSGSGTSYFGLARHRRHARRVARRLAAERLGAVFVART